MTATRLVRSMCSTCARVRRRPGCHRTNWCPASSKGCGSCTSPGSPRCCRSRRTARRCASSNWREPPGHGSRSIRTSATNSAHRAVGARSSGPCWLRRTSCWRGRTSGNCSVSRTRPPCWSTGGPAPSSSSTATSRSLVSPAGPAAAGSPPSRCRWPTRWAPGTPSRRASSPACCTPPTPLSACDRGAAAAALVVQCPTDTDGLPDRTGLDRALAAFTGTGAETVIR